MESAVKEENRPESKFWHSNPSVDHANKDISHDNSTEKENHVVNAELVIDELPETVETEEDLRNSSIFCSRVIVCLMAAGLLWMTSLQIAFGIVNIYISSPTIDTVIKVCGQSYKVIADSKKEFGDCVDRQLTNCNTRLTSQYLNEKSRVSASESANAATLLSLQRRQSNCSTTLENAKGAIQAWEVQGYVYTIPYKKCPPAELSKLKAFLGNQSVSNTYSDSASYSSSSDSTVSHLSSYANDLSAYNYNYVYNKTERLRKLSLKIVADISLPRVKGMNLSFVELGAAFDQLVACLSLSKADSLSCTYSTNMYREYEVVRLKSEAAIMKATYYKYQVEDQLNQTIAMLTLVENNIQSFYDKVQDFQHQFKVKTGISSCSFTDLCGFSMNDFPVGYPIQLGFNPIFGRMPDAGVVWAKIKNVVPPVRARITSAGVAVGSKALAWAAAMDQSIRLGPFLPSDYHPPQYQYAANTSSEVGKQKSRSKAFQDTLAAQLSAVSVKAAVLEFKQLNVSIASAVSPVSKFSLSWQALDLGGFRFASWLAGLATLRGMLYLFDYLYRAVHTVRLVRKFLGKSAVHLPYVDLRGHREGGKVSTCITYCQYALEALPFVYMQLLMLLGFVGFSVWVVVALYAPEYNSYLAGCVHHTANETFISAKVYSVGYNYAASQGNSRLTSGMQDYNSQSASYCAKEVGPSSSKYNTFLQDMSNNNQSLQRDVSNMALLSDCLNYTALDRSFEAACCTQYLSSGYFSLPGGPSLKAECDTTVSGSLKCPLNPVYQPYLPPGDYINNPTCSTLSPNGAPSGYLSSVFECQALPLCEVTCPAPDTGIINAVCKSCSCITEWLLNSVVFQYAMGLCVYLLLNLSRVLLCRGCVMVFWRSLTKEEFEVRVTCARSGEMVLVPVKQERVGGDGKKGGEEVKEEEGSKEGGHCRDPGKDEKYEEDQGEEEEEDEGEFQEGHRRGVDRPLDRRDLQEVRRGLERTLAWFVFRGCVYLVTGLAVNVAWVVALRQAHQNVTYTPN